MFIRQSQIADIDQIAKVQVDSWHETYKGLIDDDYLSSLSYEHRIEQWKSLLRSELHNQRTLVVENETREVVGFAFYGANTEDEYGYDADLHAIYLLKAYQNRGYGQQLFKRVVKDLIEMGYTSLIIWALKGNGNSRFYEKIGGRKAESRPYIYGTQAVELEGYVWEDMRCLLAV